MEGSRPCQKCRERTLVPDDITGNLVCTSCGVVQDYENFEAHIGFMSGPTGTNVRVGTAGSGSIYNYKENKIFDARRLIEDFMFKLGLSGTKSNEVKLLIERLTDGEYGQGQWFPVCVGACIYVVMRKDQKILPMVEVADLVGCDVYELGRMISRVVNFIDLKLPEFDIVDAFERSLKSCPSFNDVSEDVVQRMLQQGIFLMQCLITWFVTTGRRPMPVVAAVLVFVAELNQVNASIEDVAKELLVAVTTCRKRYKELVERLVKVAQVLPWGKDVTAKNIMKNATFVLQYMEMKSMAKIGKRNNSLQSLNCNVQELVSDCLSKDIGYGSDRHTENGSSQYFVVEGPSSIILSNNNADNFQISPECLKMVYSNFKDEIEEMKSRADIGIENNKRKRGKTFDFAMCRDWWIGKSELSKKLVLKKILEKDLGLDAMPPSFDRGCLVKQKRQEKIKSAQHRIRRIMHPNLGEIEETTKKRKKMEVDIDWEDLIIETLLLHNVKEEEIEKGHYNVLLALHVFTD